jgi:hypothetical protein
MSKTLSTKNYDIFKFMANNRQIDKNHVNQLANSLKVCNMMEDEPILVDDKFFVQDGQHRILAAKQVDETVWYKVIAPLTAEELIAKQTSKTWTVQDFFHHFLTARHPEYIKINSIMNDYDLTLNQAMLFIDRIKTEKNPSKKMSNSRSIRRGSFKCMEPEFIRFTIEKVNELREIIKNYNITYNGSFAWLQSQMFMRALLNIFRNPDVDFDTLIKKIPFKSAMIGPRANHRQYVEMWVDVYNFRNRKPISTKIGDPVDENEDE